MTLQRRCCPYWPQIRFVSIKPGPPGHSFRDQHRRTGNLAGSEAIQSAIRLNQWECLRASPHGHLRRDRQKFLGIKAGEVCNGAKDAFFPKKAIGKCGNLVHMDAAANHGTTFPGCAQRGWNQAADGSENDRRI